MSDIVRNSPSYRRNVEGLGYYWAISDYIDAQAFVDWRSSAGRDASWAIPASCATTARSATAGSSGTSPAISRSARPRRATARNTAVTWGHQQSFTQEQLPHRRTSTTPRTRRSSARRRRTRTRRSPRSAPRSTTSRRSGRRSSASAARNRQYPGRSQVDRNFPTLSITTSPLNLGELAHLDAEPELLVHADAQHRSADRRSACSCGAGKTVAGHRHGLRRHAEAQRVHEQPVVRHAAHHLRLQPRQPLHDQLGAQRLSRARDRRRRRDGRGAGAHLRDDVPDTRWTGRRRSRCPPLGRNNFNLTPSVVALERRRRRVLDPQRAHGRPVGASDQAPDLRPLAPRRRCSGCSIAAARASGRSRASGTRSRPRSATRTRRRPR